MIVGSVTSCDPKGDPGILEKVALLEAELRDRDQQIAAMQQEVNSASESKAEPTAGAPDISAANAAYLKFVENLRGELAKSMPDAKFERTSVFPVEGPDPSKPILSRVAFRITGKNGRTGEMVIPLSASPSGEWEEPETAEIVASFNSKLTEAPGAGTSSPTAPQAQAPQRTQPNDVMGASKTVEIQWDDGQPPAGKKPAAPSARQPAPPQPAPKPEPAVPKKVMPTSRDVIIDFE